MRKKFTLLSESPEAMSQIAFITQSFIIAKQYLRINNKNVRW